MCVTHIWAMRCLSMVGTSWATCTLPTRNHSQMVLRTSARLPWRRALLWPIGRIADTLEARRCILENSPTGTASTSRTSATTNLTRRVGVASAIYSRMRHLRQYQRSAAIAPTLPITQSSAVIIILSSKSFSHITAPAAL